MLKQIKNPFLVWLSLMIIAGCSAPPTDIPPGNKEMEFYHDQYLRKTKFYIPKKLKRKKRSLVLCLHNEGETAESMMRLTKHSFNKLADQDGFIVGYPEALNTFWNDGREDSISLSHYNNIDDLGYIERLIQYSIDSFRVDPGQIFVTGLSNGGFMTFRLACELSKKIKGIAAVSAGLALDQLVDCNADSTVSVMIINGTRDPMMPFTGGEMIVEERSQGSFLSAEETINFWLKGNKCKEKIAHRDMPNTNLFDETRSEKFIHANCDNGSRVVLISVTNGGHTWPGGRQYSTEKAIGKTSKDFDASDEIWRFFKNL